MHLGCLHSVTPWNPEIHPVEQVNKENHHHLISPRLASLPLPSISGMRTHWLAKFCNSFFNSHPQQLSLCIPISVVKACKHNILSLFYLPSPHCLSSSWVLLRGQGDTHLVFKFAVEDSRDDPIHEWVTSSFCILATDTEGIAFPFSREVWANGQGRSSALCHGSRKDGVGTLYLFTPQTLELHQGKVENGPKYTFILGRHFPLFSGVKCGSQDWA